MKTIETWMRKHKVSYFGATKHPFILNIRHASLDSSSFKRWLLRSRITSLIWFKKEAAKWDVQLTSITPHKTNQNYCRFLESLMQPDVDYAVAITAFWTIETVYQQCFAYCLEDDAKTPAELREACERWGSEGFGQNCNSLQEIVERSLSKVSDDVKAKAEVTFLRVLEEEVEFWNMSEGRTPSEQN
ncbi:hypothetical protein RND81_12G142100 [Saponaria officinalis]|uniref:Thiaminase-2/PQQC domain-containing protein n=1 Tax=Saponaria officinalis TaxID=3572 RepID=A0AAW1HAJ0_SAPOF